MSKAIRRLLHHYIPEHFSDPVGLTTRLVKSGDPAARFALATAAMGLIAAPLDLMLHPWEKRRYRRATPRRHPLILVCGPPRSGTTLVYQTLVRHLHVGYMSNLTALFPRSPLLATRALKRFLGPSNHTYQSYYGRTAALSGTNDALYLWDRWLGKDRTHPPTSITDERGDAMRRFFDACDQDFGLPLVNKNNNLSLSAHLIAEKLPNVHFLCLTRSRIELAKSLYKARYDIHGSFAVPYGIHDADGRQRDEQSFDDADPVTSVCSQVLFLEDQSRQQQSKVGPERFWIISYEDFCRDPSATILRVADDILGGRDCIRGELPEPFKISAGQSVPPEIANQIRQTFERLQESNAQTPSWSVSTTH